MEKEKRRLIERRYSQTILRELFKIPSNEMILNLEWVKPTSKIVILTILDYDAKEGDV